MFKSVLLRFSAISLLAFSGPAIAAPGETAEEAVPLTNMKAAEIIARWVEGWAANFNIDKLNFSYTSPSVDYYCNRDCYVQYGIETFEVRTKPRLCLSSYYPSYFFKGNLVVNEYSVLKERGGYIFDGGDHNNREKERDVPFAGHLELFIKAEGDVIKIKPSSTLNLRLNIDDERYEAEFGRQLRRAGSMMPWLYLKHPTLTGDAAVESLKQALGTC